MREYGACHHRAVQGPHLAGLNYSQPWPRRQQDQTAFSSRAGVETAKGSHDGNNPWRVVSTGSQFGNDVTGSHVDRWICATS